MFGLLDEAIERCPRLPTERLRGATAIASLLALGWLAGCATVYEGKYDWDQGWRMGRVINMGRGAALGATSVHDCRQDVSPGDVARTVYADVAYQSEGRWSRHRIVAVPEGMPLQVGQAVYLNVNACSGLAAAGSG
ncbi:MAG TPA: hypothetical protein VFA72_05415 [Burkholderiales bacterium]|nr:hypothetical protein [Burkholderiales bacterium]